MLKSSEHSGIVEIEGRGNPSQRVAGTGSGAQERHPGPGDAHDQVMGKVDAIIDVAERRQKR